MSQLTLNRIAKALNEQFASLIDMSDWDKKPVEQREVAFLSRALAALCVQSLTGISAERAGSAITDGYNDCGIDALHFDPTIDTLFLVQSKWNGTGKASFDEGSVSKFANGIKAILNDQLDRFNQKVIGKTAEIREALYSAREIKIRLITAHTGIQPIANHVARVLDELVYNLNDAIPIADRLDFDQAGIYGLITASSKDPKITLPVVLNEWGVIERPFLAYYGRVQLEQVIGWWKSHRNQLFSQNLRLYYQSSVVNDAVRKTLIEDPENFWYFNNGITIIADKVVKGIAGAPAHKFGNFTCEGASIVNGAQTVGTVGSSLDSELSEERAASWVQLRLISLENCPPDFGRRITRAANLQNAVGTREFAAMDHQQHRLATEFALDKRRYVYKTGETDPRSEDGTSIVEATQALGCAISVENAVFVKRNLGSIWADTESKPYTEIFNNRVDSAQVWRAVSVMRVVDDELSRLRSSGVDRADAVSTHLDRVILYLVHQDPTVRPLYAEGQSNDSLVEAARAAVEPIYRLVAAYLEAHHPTDYLAVFCKNTGKCVELANSVQHRPEPLATGEQADLFATPNERGWWQRNYEA